MEKTRSTRTVERDGKVLNCGITTGTCAAAAAKAATTLLLLGIRLASVKVALPDGGGVDVPVVDLQLCDGEAMCAVIKDAGDDPDVTNGACIEAHVSASDAPGIAIEGGRGVGRVTLPGLDQPVGSAAINSTPRRMIAQAVGDVLARAGCDIGLRIVISVPGGEALAARTFNPRLGIVGGISILGTTGIVEPMSERALIDTIRLETRMRRTTGRQTILFTPGNYGRDYLMKSAAIPDRAVIRCANFIGEALDEANKQGFDDILLVGHLGKLVKLAGNMFNTHSRYGDMRMETLTAYAAMQCISAETARRMMSAATVDAALDVAAETVDVRSLMGALLEGIDRNIAARLGRPVQVMLFTNARGTLASTEGFKAAFERFLKEEETWYTLSAQAPARST
ncbi:MAG: cobalamin biosynthesis protein CbiD [Clostridiales bacterium]|nr:cobalamin biosynthesis protein CbiD [Clostridiales bacterium]